MCNRNFQLVWFHLPKNVTSSPNFRLFSVSREDNVNHGHEFVGNMLQNTSSCKWSLTSVQQNSLRRSEFVKAIQKLLKKISRFYQLKNLVWKTQCSVWNFFVDIITLVWSYASIFKKPYWQSIYQIFIKSKEDERRLIRRIVKSFCKHPGGPFSPS